VSTAVYLSVLRPGPRADEILAALQDALHPEALRRDGANFVPVFMPGHDGPGAWDAVCRALDETGGEHWWRYVSLGPRPQS
jgi:hypothetical protein